MPASKLSHVLSVLRKNLALRQTQLAKMVGCSVATITSIEVGRLKFSESLAKRIAAATGCDEQWLLAGDASVPMPPKQPVFRKVASGHSGVTRLVRRGSRDQVHVYTIYLLMEVFSRLLAEVRKLEKTNARNTLENCIRKELEVLEKTQTAPDALPLHSATKQTLQDLRKRFGLPAELLNLGIDLEHLIETAPEAKAKSPSLEQKIHLDTNVLFEASSKKRAPTTAIDALENEPDRVKARPRLSRESTAR
jgi:DNA-binding XRE family transcriptional regulator